MSLMGMTWQNPAWTATHEDAECLYMILRSIVMDDKTGIDFLRANEIGDTDGDGFYEVLDAFGDPLLFEVSFDTTAPNFLENTPFEVQSVNLIDR